MNIHYSIPTYLYCLFQHVYFNKTVASGHRFSFSVGLSVMADKDFALLRNPHLSGLQTIWHKKPRYLFAFLFVRSYYFNQSVIFSFVAWFALNGLHHFAEYFFLIFTAIFCGSIAPLVVKIAAFFPFRFTLSRKLNTAFGNVPHQIGLPISILSYAEISGISISSSGRSFNKISFNEVNTVFL